MEWNRNFLHAIKIKGRHTEQIMKNIDVTIVPNEYIKAVTKEIRRS